MESFVALTRFQAGRPRFKGEERQRAGLEADGSVFPLTTAERRKPGLCQFPLLTGDQQPGGGRRRAPRSPSSQQGSETGGLWGSYRPGRAPLRATHPDTLQRYRLVSCWGLSGLAAAARACLAQSESKFNVGKSQVAHRRRRTNALQRELCGFERHSYRFKPRAHNTAPLQNIMKVNN